VWRSCSRAAACDQARPRVGPVRMQNSGPTAVRRGRPAGTGVALRPVIHAHLAAAGALSVADEHCGAAGIDVSFAEGERLVDA
jgi:hypothetical protein